MTTMNNQHPASTAEPDENWQLRTILVGSAVGALIGLGASWLLVRTSRESVGGPPHVTTGDALKLGITTVGLVRAIAALGNGR